MSEPIVDELETIPETLHERDQWVCWREEGRDGKPTKIPVTPGAGGSRHQQSRRPGRVSRQHLSTPRRSTPMASDSCLPTTIPSSALIWTTAVILKPATSTTRRWTSSSDSTPIRRYRRPVPAITCSSGANSRRGGIAAGASNCTTRHAFHRHWRPRRADTNARCTPSGRACGDSP